MSADRVRAYIALGANLGDSAATPQDGAGRTAPDAWHRRRDRLALLPHRSGRGHRPRLRQRRRGAGHHAGAAGTAGRAAGPGTAPRPRAPLQERAAHAGPGHAAPTATSPSKTRAWSCPIPACTCAPSCCVRCWTWPHPARRRPPGRRLAGRHPRPAHLPAVRRRETTASPSRHPGQAPRPAPHRPPESRPHGAGSAGP